jgi:hypothetical protein
MRSDRYFTDAQKIAEENPATFSIIEVGALRRVVKVGAYLKVCSGKERFWTQVTYVNGDFVKATVANELLGEEYEFGEEVEFTLMNVYDYLPDDAGTTDNESTNLCATHDTCN